MLKPLRVVLGVLLLMLFAGPVSQMLSEAEAFAQSVDTAWVKRYNGPADSTDYGYAITVDDSGYVYVTGYSYGSGTGYDYATIKYKPNGDTAWVRRYSGPGNSVDVAVVSPLIHLTRTESETNARILFFLGMDIAIDDSNNVYVTGCSYGSGTSYDYTTIKYYPNGDTAWVSRYNGPGNSVDVAMDIAIDDSNNVYVTGYSYGSGTNSDYATIKYKPNGDTAWVRRYNGPGNDYDWAYAMALDGSGNVYVTGRSDGSGTHGDYATIKYKPNGDTAWVMRYNGPGNSIDVAMDIAIDDSNNVYVTGGSYGSGTNSDYTTIKYKPNGDTAWVSRYNGPGNNYDCAHAIALDDSGNVYVTGYSDGSGTSYDYTTIKYYPNGDTAWVRRYNGPGNDYDWAYAIALDDSGYVYVTGKRGSGTDSDYATIKYYPDGDTVWVRVYNGPINGGDRAYDLAVDDSGNVYVTGYSEGSGTGDDYCTIKYFQTASGVKDETGSRERPSEFDLSQNYPNPFNPTTKIEFTLSKSGFVTLQIYDVLGRKVRTLVSEDLSSGYKSVLWDGKNNDGKDVASGAYFYQLKVGDFSEPKKMLLLK
ncbi:MAG: SBBP repeat-containing protein [candidate division Zixibacteria bacterium]|nr:SBBP repeat-containing protein [candidate division Zixibacteria bacterium]